MKNPLLAITMGDPAGVGAEIIVKAYDDLSSGSATIVVVGSADCLRQAMLQTGCQHLVKVIGSPENVVDSLQAIQVLEPVSFDASSLVLSLIHI